MKQLNGVYTTRYNMRRKRFGHIFQGRFKSVLVENAGYQGKLIRYIVFNPIAADIVKNLKDWDWSSHKEMLNSRINSGCLHTNEALKFFDDDIIKAKGQYIEYLNEGLYNDNIWDDLHSGFILGSIGFVENIMSKHERIESVDIPKRERFAGRPELENIFRNVKSRVERNEKIKKAFYEFGYTQAEIAKYLNIHYSSVSRIIKMSKFKA